MTQHYTRNTQSVAAWCNKCKKETQHIVSDRRRGPCSDCLARLNKEHEEAKKIAPPAEQRGLFK
jgi:ribosomal protein L44E